MPPPYSLAGSHQKSPSSFHPFTGIRLTLYRAKERGRQVLPPSFASATLEIYYADSGGAVGRSSGEERRAVCKEEGRCGNLKLYLPYAPNDFSPPFVSLPPPSFSHILAGYMLRPALVTCYSYIYSYGYRIAAM